MEHPTAGVETMVNMLVLSGIVVNAKRVRRLLRKMDIWAIYPRTLVDHNRPAGVFLYM